MLPKELSIYELTVLGACLYGIKTFTTAMIGVKWEEVKPDDEQIMFVINRANVLHFATHAQPDMTGYGQCNEIFNCMCWLIDQLADCVEMHDVYNEFYNKAVPRFMDLPQDGELSKYADFRVFMVDTFMDTYEKLSSPVGETD